MPTRYGRSPWVDLFPKSRVPAYPKHRGPLKVDAVIVGGGLTGAATAYAFAAAGVKVALFEADRIGTGTSGFSSGWIAEDPGASLVEAQKALGKRATRAAWQSWRRASLDFIALIKRLEIKCHLEPCGSILVGLTPEQVAFVKREHDVRREDGLEGSLATARVIAEETGLSAHAGIRTTAGATIDPYRATLGLAAAAVDRGAQIFERSPVRAIKFNRKDAEVITAGGSFRVARVVAATAMPTQVLFRSLARHFWMKSTFFALTDPIPSKIRNRLATPTTVVRDAGAPSHVIRWVDDRLLIEGAASMRIPPAQREKTMVQRTGQLMYELSTMYPDISGIMPAYGWETPFALTGEGVPYIGPHRNFPHQLLAFGDSSHGVTGAYLASRVLLRHYLGELDAADEAFSFTR